MSFGDLAPNLPVTAGLFVQPSPPTAASAAAELRGDLAALAANNAALRRSSAALRATPSNVPPHAELRRVRTLRSQNRELARNATALANRLDDFAVASTDRQLERTATKLREELRTLLAEFSEALRESVECEKAAVAVAPLKQTARVLSPNSVAVEESQALRTPRETDALLSSVQTQRSLQEDALLREMRANDQLREQRNDALREIQTSVDDVNAIMKDLAVMIGDQGTQLDYVEVTVSEAADRNDAAQRELSRAEKRREGKRRFFFALLIVVASIIAVLLLILLS